jgi:hypothetical protein
MQGMLATFQFGIDSLNVCYINSYRLKYTELQFCPQLYIGIELGLSCEERYEVLSTKSCYRDRFFVVFVILSMQMQWQYHKLDNTPFLLHHYSSLFHTMIQHNMLMTV